MRGWRWGVCVWRGGTTHRTPLRSSRHTDRHTARPFGLCVTHTHAPHAPSVHLPPFSPSVTHTRAPHAPSVPPSYPRTARPFRPSVSHTHTAPHAPSVPPPPFHTTILGGPLREKGIIIADHHRGSSPSARRAFEGSETTRRRLGGDTEMTRR